jgi:hypothetical protein
MLELVRSEDALNPLEPPKRACSRFALFVDAMIALWSPSNMASNASLSEYASLSR